MVRSKRFLSLIASVALAISLFQSGGVSAKASEEVTEFHAELKDFPSEIHVGDTVPTEPYEVEVEGDEEVEVVLWSWQKEILGTFKDYSPSDHETFSSGKFRYYLMLKLTDDDSTFSEKPVFNINNQVWQAASDAEYPQYVVTVSPTFVVSYDSGAYSIDISDGEPFEIDGEDGSKLVNFFKYAIGSSIIKIQGSEDKYDLNYDREADLQIVFDEEDPSYVKIYPLLTATKYGEFEATVSYAYFDYFTAPTFTTVTMLLPEKNPILNPLNKGKLTLDLHIDNKVLCGDQLEVFLNTIKASGKSKYETTDTTTEVAEVDLDGDGRADLTLSPHTYTQGTYSVCVSMNAKCTSYKNNKYELALEVEEMETQISYGKEFFSTIEFIRPTSTRTHNLSQFTIDMRGDKTVELKDEQAAAFLATVLFEDDFPGKATYIYPDIKNESKTGSVINLDLDPLGAVKGDDVILEVSTKPDLVVKISPLPSCTVSFYIYTELSPYSQSWFETKLFRDFYTPILFMFADDPNNPLDPYQPITPDTPNNPTDPANPTKGGFTPAPLVKSTVPVHSVGEVVVYEGVTYVITSVTAGSEAVTYNKPVSAKVTSADIPDAILIDGVAYNVTEISAGCFNGNKKLKKVTIGVNVSKIGGKAFYKCKNLKTIKVRTPLLIKANVGSNAFKGLHAKAKVKVPKSQLKAYKKLFKSKGLKGSKQKVTK